MEELKNIPGSGEEQQEEAVASKEQPLEFTKNLNETVILPDLAEEPLERDPVQKAAQQAVNPEEAVDQSSDNTEQFEVIPTGSEKPKKKLNKSEHFLNIEEQSEAEQKVPETVAVAVTAAKPTRKKDDCLKYSRQQLAEMSFSEIVDAVVLLVQQDELPQQQEIETIKAAFEKKKSVLQEQKNDSERQEYQEAIIQESRLKDMISAYQERYKEYLEEQNRIEQKAFEKKSALLERLKELINSNREFGAISSSFREIEEEWRSTGRVPEEKAKTLQDEYTALRESFYDLKQINNEFRDYDFKKNLEAKEELIRRAEELSKSDNTSAANREISELHARWKDIGPVAKELRDEIWERFSAVSKEIRDRQQAFFNSRKEEEEKNLEEKKNLCMEVEDISYDTLTSIKLWNKAKENVIKLQAQWKEIGQVPRSESNAIYKRFRGACDVFFSQKAIFFKELHDKQDENYRLKMIILEEAEALSTSTDWEKTAQRLKELQQQWREIGPISPRFDIWERFRLACNNFFDARKKNSSERRKESSKYVEEKKKLIHSVKELLSRDESDDRNLIREEVHTLIEQFKQNGDPASSFRRRIHKEFYDTVNEIFKKWKLDRNSRRMDSFSDKVGQLADSGDRDKLRNEMTYLTRTREHLKEEIKNSENNMQLMTSSSQWGHTVLKEMEKKIEVLRKEAELIEEKISLVREKIIELREEKASDKKRQPEKNATKQKEKPEVANQEEKTGNVEAIEEVVDNDTIPTETAEKE